MAARRQRDESDRNSSGANLDLWQRLQQDGSNGCDNTVAEQTWIVGSIRNINVSGKMEATVAAQTCLRRRRTQHQQSKLLNLDKPKQDPNLISDVGGANFAWRGESSKTEATEVERQQQQHGCGGSNLAWLGLAAAGDTEVTAVTRRQ